MPAWNRNRLTAKLGIDYPVIQGPLGGLSSQKLTAAVSNFGGLGAFGAHGLAPEAIKDVIAEIRSLTSKPFAMNLWVSMEDEGARTSDDVREQPKIADAASELLQDVFGKDKNPCRLVYGVASLPLGTPVELELIFEVSV